MPGEGAAPPAGQPGEAKEQETTGSVAGLEYGVYAEWHEIGKEVDDTIPTSGSPASNPGDVTPGGAAPTQQNSGLFNWFLM